MYFKKIYTLSFLLFSLFTGTFNTVNIGAQIHPIAQECNKNAQKIKNFMKHHAIVIKKFNTPSINSEISNENSDEIHIFVLLPSWLILEKFEKTLDNQITY